MRNTIKSHQDFKTDLIEPAARCAYFVIRTKNAKFSDDPRYGLVVTKKRFKHAVQRNRAKRLLRDWIAFNENKTVNKTAVIFVSVGCALGLILSIVFGTLYFCYI